MHSATRTLFLALVAIVAISVYMLFAAHHVHLPSAFTSKSDAVTHQRDKVDIEALHHMLLEDFTRFDRDKDNKLGVHEFAAMLREANRRAKAGAKPALTGQEERQTGALQALQDLPLPLPKPGSGRGREGAVLAEGGRVGDPSYEDREEYYGDLEDTEEIDDDYREVQVEAGAGGAGGGKRPKRHGGVGGRGAAAAAAAAAAGGGNHTHVGAGGDGSEDWEVDVAGVEDVSIDDNPHAAADGNTSPVQKQEAEQAAARRAAEEALSGKAAAAAATPAPAPAPTPAPTAAAAAAAAPAPAAAPARAAAAAAAAAKPAPAPAPAAAAAAAAVAPAAGAAAAAAAGGCPELSREHVAAFARNNTIMLTVADWRIFGTMGINWMKHLAKWGVDYYYVGATDERTAQFLGHVGKHPCFKFYEAGAASAGEEYKYGNAHYNAATWRKVVVVSRIVHWGFNVIHSDVDVVWFRDPLPYFMGPAVAGVDVAVSSDLISTQNPVGDAGLEVAIHAHINFNTGVYFVRASPGGKAFMAGWAAMRRTQGHENDQVGVYRFIRHRRTDVEERMLVLRHAPEEAASAAAYDKDPAAWERAASQSGGQGALPVGTDVRLGGLPVHVLLNGYSYFIPKLHERMNATSLGVHMTWVPLSKEGKFHRFRDGMLYDDPPEYYDAPGLRFLTADIDAPDAPPGFNGWRETEDMIQVHLKNMPPQLQQMYRAVAAAAVLNRTLIMPRLRCYCFKNWFMSEQCRIPGDKVTQFPLDCALDQVFRPKVLYNYPPLETSHGPQNFTFREYSLLDNPRTPAAVREGQVLVVPEGADAGNTTGFQRVVTLKPGLLQDDFVKALEGVKDAKVLRLRHPMQLFGGFNDQVLKESLAKFADAVTANWCCRDEPYIAKGLAKKVKMAMNW